MPEIRRGQGEPGTGPDRSDFGSRHLRRRVSAQGRSARRKQRQFRLCRRRSAAARRISAISRAGRSRSRRRRGRRLSGNIAYPSSPLEQRAAAAGLWRGAGRPDLAGRAGRCARGRRHRTAARGHAGLKPPGAATRQYPPYTAPSLSVARPRGSALFAAPGAQRRCRGSDRRRAIPSAPFGPVAVKPAATLACPIVSVLDRWLADSVQPAAHALVRRARGRDQADLRLFLPRHERQFRTRIFPSTPSATRSTSRRFTLADGRRISVKDGWHGMPEEQGFLRDVQAAACQQFNTVLAPGSNVYHYDHIHVDLMRRATRRVICQPAAVSGEEVAARAARRNPYASREPNVTGSLGGAKPRRIARPRSTRKTSSRTSRGDTRSLRPPSPDTPPGTSASRFRPLRRCARTKAAARPGR